MHEKQNISTDKINQKIDKIGQFIDGNIESKIFKIRHLVLISVIGSLILAFMLFFAGLTEVYEAGKYLILEHDIKEFSIYVLKSSDLFLFGMVMIIFALGSYNLFVSKIDNVATDVNNKVLPEWLTFSDFDTLKILFIKVIILILSISFLELLIKMEDKIMNAEPYIILIVPLGILMLSYSLKLIHGATHSD